MESVFDRQGRNRNLLGAFSVLSEIFTKSSRAEQDLKWAQIWYSKLLEFHARRGDKSPSLTHVEVALFR